MSLAEDFKRFCKERVRSVRDGFSELMTEKVTLKEIKKAYNRWAVLSGKRYFAQMTKDTQAHFVEICEETFGDSRGTNIYQGFRVFLDEDDLEDFDKEHETKEQPPVASSESNQIKTLTEKVVTIEYPTLEAKISYLTKHIYWLESELERRDKLFDGFAKKDVQRDKELIKIINSLKTLLTLAQ